jgi:hypothetical protein
MVLILAAEWQYSANLKDQVSQLQNYAFQLENELVDTKLELENALAVIDNHESISAFAQTVDNVYKYYLTQHCYGWIRGTNRLIPVETVLTEALKLIGSFQSLCTL